MYQARNPSDQPSSAKFAAANFGAAEHVGCYRDASNRVLAYDYWTTGAMTPEACVNHCRSKGWKMAGLEVGSQCFCGDSYGTAAGVDGCKQPCTGDKSKVCGGRWELDIWRTGATGGNTNSGSNNGNSNNSNSNNNNNANTNNGNNSGNSGGQQQGNKDENKNDNTSGGNSNGAQGQATVSSNAATLINTNKPAIAGNRQKYLWAHHMVGNTRSYNKDKWAQDIQGAMDAGFDGFALNMGRDDYQPRSVDYAYQAAQGKNFKLFFSFDMTSFPCGSTGDADRLADLTAKYAGNSAQAKYNNKVLVSSFAGENCQFGKGSVQDGWNYFREQVKKRNIDIYFLPAHFAKTDTFGSSNWFDGVMNWNGQWPSSNANPNLDSDNQYLSALGGRGYMAGISPFFFTYYGPNSWNKNWIYRSDDWLLATRWEQLLTIRNRFDHLQFVSWNDWGESHYVANPGAAEDQPNSQGWTNNMPHTGLSSLIKYYAEAWKKGSFPAPNDQVWVWSRPHPKAANPTAPTNPRPNHADWTDDNAYALVLLAEASDVVLESGVNKATFKLDKGMNKVAVASAEGPIKVTVNRGGKAVKSLDTSGKFSYTKTPKDYNFNYYVQNA